MAVVRTLPARKGVAIRVDKGQAIKIINTTGTQVVDTWAFVTNNDNLSTVAEHLSLTHTRVSTTRLSPCVGDILSSNRRKPMLKIIEDTSPGQHDTQMAACDPRRYELYGLKDWQNHDSCAQNLITSLSAFNEAAGCKGQESIGYGFGIDHVPAPLNLFMNVPWTANGDLSFDSPKTRPGDYVRLEAVQDVVVVLSACPMDLNPINGSSGPQDAHFIVEGSQRLNEGG